MQKCNGSMLYFDMLMEVCPSNNTKKQLFKTCNKNVTF